MFSIGFYLAAVFFFCLSAAGVALGGIPEIPVGLACFAFAHLPLDAHRP